MRLQCYLDAFYRSLVHVITKESTTSSSSLMNFLIFAKGCIILINNLIQASECTLVGDNRNQCSLRDIEIT